MDIASLHLCVEIARRGSFAAVARDRGLDPSSVSRTVAQLETQLGIRLFQRTTRRLTPTEAGDLFLSRVDGLIDELERARDEAATISARPTGTLRLTASVAFGHTCLVPLLPAFRRKYPSLRLELLLTDATLDLVAERVDLAIRLAPKLEGDVVGAKLMETRYRICASPTYVETAKPIRRPGDLRDHRCVLLDLPAFRSRWRFVAADSKTVQEVPVDGDVVISNALAVRECALAGMGPVLLASWLVDDDLARGRLVDLFPAHRVAATDFDTAAWLVYPSRRYLPSKVRVTIDSLRDQLSGGNSCVAHKHRRQPRRPC